MDEGREPSSLSLPGGVEHLAVPTTIAAAGPHAVKRFMEFFAATIRNRNTRVAYLNAVGHFLRWCENHGVMDIRRVEPLVVACYVEELAARYAKPTVKQRLAAIRTLFDWLVTGQVVPYNPAASVRGPSIIMARGKTPVLTAEQTRELLDSIPVTDVCGLRDRALIAVMVFSFARVSAAVGLRVRDYFPEGKRWRLRLHEKGGKEHVVPCHHVAEEYLDQYLNAVGMPQDTNALLFRTIDPRGSVTPHGMTRNDAFRMVKRRVRAAGLPGSIGCHTFRATGITAYLSNGGTIENAQAIAAHESPRTTKLYDRRQDAISLDEIERIVI
jgi:site-specific recombinase XerD